MSRTHWAIKDEDLFEILASAGLVDQTFVGEDRPPGRVEEMRFKVAISFLGEKRDYVAAVAAEVKKRLSCEIWLFASACLANLITALAVSAHSAD